MSSRIYLFLILLIFTITFQFSFAQHHSGQQAPPISFGSGQVTVNTSLFPADFIPGKNSDVNLKIQFFDISTNVNIESVTYRVQIFYGTQLVANQMFFDKDGELDIKIQPRSECDQEELWKCTKYQGETDPVVPNALTSSALSTPIITGPVFSKNGQYTVKTDIIGATNPKTQTTEDITFETSITIPHEQQFMITSSNILYPIMVKNFQKSITNLQYDESSHSIIFQMPFEWNNVEHVDSVKNYFEIPKNFPPFHNGYKAIVSYDSRYSLSNEHLFSIAFFDSQGNLASNVRYGYSIKDPLGKEIVNTGGNPNILGISLPNGVDTRIITNSLEGNYLMQIVLIGIGTNDFERFIFKEFEFEIAKSEIPKTIPNQEKTDIPEWIKNNAGWWASGQIDDNSFVQGIQFMIKNKLMNIPPTSQGSGSGTNEIPSWIKNNAGWWASGQIDDGSFIQGIQYLIKEGIIRV